MHKETRRDIGKRLREARVAAGLTQEDVAQDFHLSRQAISAWESGKSLPSLPEFRDLLTRYGVSADLVLYGLDDVAGATQIALDGIRIIAETNTARVAT